MKKYKQALEDLDWPALPALLDEAAVRYLLGRVPRDLENMVVCDPKRKPARKLFSRGAVQRLAEGGTVRAASQGGRNA